MSQWVNCLLYKHEDLSLGTQYPHNKLDVALHICNHSMEG